MNSPYDLCQIEGKIEHVSNNVNRTSMYVDFKRAFLSKLTSTPTLTKTQMVVYNIYIYVIFIAASGVEAAIFKYGTRKQLLIELSEREYGNKTPIAQYALVIHTYILVLRGNSCGLREKDNLQKNVTCRSTADYGNKKL